VAEAVNHWPVTTDAEVQFQAILCVIYGGQHDTGTGFSLSILILPCHYHSANVPYSFIRLSLMLYNLSNRFVK
jgi:hypothetical protein